MIVVTNRIKTKLGFAEKMAPAFTKPGALQTMKGFVKVEVLITQNLSEYDELNINMYWESFEDFTAWKNSDAFKEAHKGAKGDKGDSPILGSELTTYAVASTLEALPK
ncbi:heme-degrading monooxygenase [Pullulanibacillus camelliae]|uniref:Heme-degrading monooxygenase n=1 Tax=Pullulanibacillus camelliae TaxID=1707096 RepID=A0A8J2VGL0_9BACL|nr:heme oxygenase [Pullulanibacillus camelliae]GGE30263.1 heme-degrading monooxygenase [Pullulanibacillus camelliae]